MLALGRRRQRRSVRIFKGNEEGLSIARCRWKTILSLLGFQHWHPGSRTRVMDDALADAEYETGMSGLPTGGRQ